MNTPEHMKDFVRQRRASFLKAENEARLNPEYNPDYAKIIDKSALEGWGKDELNSIFSEVRGIANGSI